MDQEKALREYAALLDAKLQYEKYHLLEYTFPDTGKYPRNLYPVHLEFMQATKKYSQLASIAANRTGKTHMGGFMSAVWLTGLYPEWWAGRHWDRAVSMWASSKTSEMTKKILQFVLLGSPNDIGSGMIPKERIHNLIKKSNVPEGYETVYVKAGKDCNELSECNFKSYDQGVGSFQGTKKDIIWLDEEPDPQDSEIYTECLTRTAGDEGDSGLIFCTFTPLLGLTKVVTDFIPDGSFDTARSPYKYVCRIGWDDVPHLSEAWKTEAAASYSPHERDARMKGYPTLGSGSVYPYPEENIAIEPFSIPEHWSRGYGLDIGIGRTAACWATLDPESQIYYIYAEHYVSDGVPAVHSSAIRARGTWIVGAIDPSSDRRTVDGKNTLLQYEDEGLLLAKAENALESGISSVRQLFEQGRLRVFTTCPHWFSEFRKYRRDKEGNIPRHLQDHLMDAMRYFFVTGIHYMRINPRYEEEQEVVSFRSTVNKVTGY